MSDPMNSPAKGIMGNTGIFERLRAAIITDVRTALPELKTCRAHSGPLTHERLGHISAAAPGILISLMAVRDITIHGGDVGDLLRGPLAFDVGAHASPDTAPTAHSPSLMAGLDFAAFIITRHGARDADGAALDLAGRLTQIIAQNSFGLENVQMADPKTIRAEGLWLTSGRGAQGISLWAVRWRHQVLLAPEGEAADIAPIRELHIRDARDGTVDAVIAAPEPDHD